MFITPVYRMSRLILKNYRLMTFRYYFLFPNIKENGSTLPSSSKVNKFLWNNALQELLSFSKVRSSSEGDWRKAINYLIEVLFNIYSPKGQK